MNLILLRPEDFPNGDSLAHLTGTRHRHLRDVLNAKVGSQFIVGLVDGPMGQGEVAELTDETLSLRVTLDSSPPPPLPVSLILALPRPKVLRRVLAATSSMGVKQIYIINAYRVEKSYWQSPFLQPEQVEAQLLLGLEQGRDTKMPEVFLRDRFKPFVEDELPSLLEGSTAWLADLGGKGTLPSTPGRKSVLAVGPEGGFVPYEVRKLIEVGFQTFCLGPRPLRVETAAAVALGRFL